MSRKDDFERIDKCIELYYNQCGHYKYKKDGVGRFMKFINDEQFNEHDTPIEHELGSDCDPTECAYSWMFTDSDSPFPVPQNIQIPPHHMEEYIFYILQYCYKHNTSPPTQYIKDNIVGKVDGTCNDQLQNENNRSQDYIKSSNYTHSTENNNYKRVSEEEFQPKYPPRAKLNIYTAKELTEALLNMIAEPFPDSVHLYYYIDISTALQMNDHQIREYTVLSNGKQYKFGIINYDLHCKNRSNDILYGIIIPNDDREKKDDKWLWKLNEFLTSKEILNKYHVKSSELPQSSRKMDKFQKQLKNKLVIDEEIIDDTDWLSVNQIKSSKRNVKIAKESVTLSIKTWIKECKKSLQNNNLPLIPVVISRNNNHWIEWIKIIYIKSKDFYVGISFKYMEDNKKWKVQIICLDSGDIYNKHRLVGLIDNKYIEQLKDFKFSKTKIKFNDNDDDNDNDYIVSDSDEKKTDIFPKSTPNKPIPLSLNQLNELNHENMINLIDNQFKSMIYRTKWEMINIHNTISNGIEYKLCLQTKEFKKILLKHNDNKKDIILIGVRDHVEYLKIVKISDNSIGISFISGSGSRKNTIKVAAIYTNIECIKERQKLLCPNHKCKCLDNFVSNIDVLQIGDTNKLNVLLNQLQLGHMKQIEFVEYIIHLIEGIQDSNIDIQSLVQILNAAKKMINREENQSVDTYTTFYIKTLEDIQYFYYQQGVNNSNQPIQQHPIHQQIQQFLQYSTMQIKHN